MQPLRSALAVALALPYLGALAQDVSLPELVKGEKLASTMKAADIPADYKAVKLKVSGESGYMDMVSGPIGMLMMFSGGMRSNNGNEAAQAELFSMMQLSWTKGEVVHLLSADAAAAKAAGTAAPSTDDQYLVTYTADFDIAQLITMSSGGGKALSTDLKLVLVKVTSISAITPAPDVTRERFVKALESAGSVMASTSTMQDTATATAPTAVDQGVPMANPDQSRAVSNGKQLALGTIMYCSDNDDVLPYVQSVVTVKEVIQPYLKNLSVWNTGNPASQWRFNMCIGGVSMTDIPEPAGTPLFYESAPWPDGNRVVAYTDGHVKLVSASQWNALAKYLKLKLKRTAKKPLPVHQTGMGATKAPDMAMPPPARGR